MSDLTGLPNAFDVKHCLCRAIIETRKGSRNKFTYDSESSLFKLGGLLPEGMVFPFDFGFIPSTLGDDSDPMGIMVLMDAPAQMGCLLGMSIHSYDHQGLETINDISKVLLDQVEEFFASYNKQRGKKFTIRGRGGPAKAIRALKTGIRAHRAKTQ